MKKETSFVMPNPYLSFMVGLAAGVALYAALTVLCGDRQEGWLRRMIGYESSRLCQSVYLFLYILFFWGLAFILFKGRLGGYERKNLLSLQEKFPGRRIISERKELEAIRGMMSQGTEGIRIRNTAVGQVLLFLIDHCLVVGTSERIVEIFTRRMDTLQKDMEASYSILRYIAWAIPSLGFIGTVLGIGAALSMADQALENIRLVTQPLGMAFDTTLIALLECVVLMFLIYHTQHKEENLLNAIDLFCQERFIINLRLEQKGLMS